MRECDEKILIATGITGGHFFPAVCFAEAYQHIRPTAEICFVLGKRKAPFDLSSFQERFHFEFIFVKPFPKLFSFELFYFPFSYFKSLIITARFFKKFKPSALVSFGSFSTFPLVLIAWLFRIPIVLHEQNRIFGLANRVSSFFASRVTTSFPETLGQVSFVKTKRVGYPIRESLRCHKGGAGIASSSRRILVLGGSQGSRALNQAALRFFSQLTTEEKKKVAVIHITGEKEFKQVSQCYANLGAQSEVYSFVREIEQCYERAHLVIARAGAGTIFELAVFGLPGILVPYPFAYKHQLLNATYVAEQGGALLVKENHLKETDIKTLILELLFNDVRRETVAQAMKRFDAPQAAEQLAQIVCEVQGVTP